MAPLYKNIPVVTYLHFLLIYFENYFLFRN
nr:MAG TPA: hypothetical protein [Caudoviricetes sp.]